MVPVGLPLVFGQDQGDIPEKAEGGIKIDLGLMFDQGDDEEGGAALEVDPLYRVRVPAVLEEGEEALGDILNIVGAEAVPEFQRNIVLEELDKEDMVAEEPVALVEFLLRQKFPIIGAPRTFGSNA
jgi:hypothetical protein